MIFISYRSSDTHEKAAMLEIRLRQEFPDSEGLWVFRDKTRLKGGQVWSLELEKHLKNSRVLLALIGPDWQTAVYKEEKRKGMLCLWEKDDVVRKEICSRLEARECQVIPILIRGAVLPPPEWLARCGLEGLAGLQYMELNVDDFEPKAKELLSAASPK